MADKKPWEEDVFGVEKPKPRKRKKPKKPAGPGSVAEDVIGELEERNKNLAPYAKTGPGAPKKKKKKKS